MFAGVVNAGEGLLPSYLAHLERFFGPPVNSPLLPATLAALAGLVLWLVVRTRAEARPGARHAGWLLVVLAALALLEHALLGVRVSPALWEPFLGVRGGG